MPGKILTITGVSRHLGVPRRTLYNWLNTGRFDVPPIAGTNPRRWNVEAIDAWRGVTGE